MSWSNYYAIGRLLYADRDIAIFTQRARGKGGRYHVWFIDMRDYRADKLAGATNLGPVNYSQIEEAKEANELGISVPIPEPVYREQVACISREEFMEEVRRVYNGRRFELAEAEFVYPPSKFDAWNPVHDEQGEELPECGLIRELRAIIPGGIMLTYWLPGSGSSGDWDWKRRNSGEEPLWEVLPLAVIAKADRIQKAYHEECERVEAIRTAARKAELAKKFGVKA